MVFKSFLDQLCRRTIMRASVTVPQPLWIGFSTTAPSDDGSGISEPDASTGYKRIEIGGFESDGDGVAYNSNDIIYDGAVEPLKDLTWCILYDKSSVRTGTPLFAEQLEAPLTINPGETLLLRPGSIKLSFGDLKVNL